MSDVYIAILRSNRVFEVLSVLGNQAVASSLPKSRQLGKDRWLRSQPWDHVGNVQTAHSWAGL
jgi:hypothetical protein